jgi:glycosyltransferase involved in cell wall biosynthesis
MRVAILSPVWFPVPPTGYGGIEWIVHLLADGLVDAGVDVTLFASGDSRTKARLESVFDEAPSEWIGHTFWELQHASACLEQATEGRFDIVHDHSGLLALALGALAPVPFVHTVHGPLDGDAGDLYETICEMAPRAHLVSLTHAQRRPKPGLPWLANCPNALDLDLYPFDPGNDGYLLFLGRMSPDKGAHRAIEVARAAGLPLRLAGKCRERFEQAYFEAEVRPGLGEGIEYLGEVTHAEKVELLQRARTTIFPIDWEEPFGLVMIESIACGTPVIGTRRGSVPEVLDDGVTGIIVDDYREMGDALSRADALDPQVLRRTAEERFTPQRMVDNHLAVYEQAVALDRDRGRRAGSQVPDAPGSASASN